MKTSNARPTETGSSGTGEFERIAATVGHKPLATITQRAVRRHLKKIEKQMRRVREGDASEAIHKLRVATRGMRAALEMLDETDAYERTHLDELRGRLKRLTHALGEVRDLDVFVENVKAYEGEHSAAAESSGLKMLRDTLMSRREMADAHLLREVHRKRTRHLLRDLRHLADGLQEEHGGKTEVLVRHVAGSVIWRRYESVLAFEGSMPDASTDTLHALRIACKRLRYVLELFVLTDGKKDPALLVALRAAQDYLGRLHDDVVDLETVHELQARSAGDGALADYAQMLADDRDSLCRGVGQHWESLSGSDTRQQLADFIVAL